MTPHPEVADVIFQMRTFASVDNDANKSTLTKWADRLESALTKAEAVELDYVPGLLDQTCPPRIWLQIDTNGDNEDRSEAFPESAWGDLTWCYESIGGQEVVYIRADLVAHAPPAVPVPPYSAPFTTDVPQCCESPETCPEPCAPPPASVPDGSQISPSGILPMGPRIPSDPEEAKRWALEQLHVLNDEMRLRAEPYRAIVRRVVNCTPGPFFVPQADPRDDLISALERATAAESALRRLVDECENDHVRGWEDRMNQCIAEANALLASQAPPTNQEGAAP